MKAVIFLGPSLPLPQAREHLDAIYRPPAAQGDVLSAVTMDAPDVIGLVDGEFLQSCSVWHKEILYALHRGIRVYGASSMGALRAAETAMFGMVGVGEVYRLYARGELTDDGDVAVAHGTVDSEYRPMSEPVVNILMTLQLAKAEGLVDEHQQRSLLTLARSIYFPERTLHRFFSEAAGIVPLHVLEGLSTFFSERLVDVKRADAILLLQTIRELDPLVPPPTPSFHFERSFLFDALYERDRRVRHDDVNLALSDIAAWTALHHPLFADLHFGALNRAVVALLGALLDVKAPNEEIERESHRFRTQNGLAGAENFAEWLDRNDLSAAEFRALMTDVAICRLFHRWLLTGQDREGGTKILLDELRLRGCYEECAQGAADQEHILRAEHVGSEPCFSDATTTELVEDHLRHTDCSIDVPFPIWAYEAGFRTIDEFHMELVRARTARARVARLWSVIRAARLEDEPRQ